MKLLQESMDRSMRTQAMSNFIGTELLIDRLLTKLGHTDDELKDWPADAAFNEHLKKRLSHSKMENKINDTHMRTRDKDANPIEMGICSTKIGSHSSISYLRRSQLDPMGEGINLYFKMLGCFAWMFLLTLIASIPPILIYTS